tara:strand:- start:5880 stop:6872 length:993 start_codon:yes stop_codon:yes gene_type:complete
MFNNKSILITGGTGSFGKEFSKKILKRFKPKKLIIFSRDELKQSLMEKDEFFVKYKKILRFFIGDVRDRDRLKLAVKNVDYVVHAAALKHVNVAEYNPFEFIKTNIMGTQNLIDVCIEGRVKKIIALSTDKAASAINLYGATKLASDKLIVASNSYSGPKTQLSVVRYGNVFGSRGSVAEIFLKSIRKKEALKLTHPKMTRFNITLPQSVDFVMKCFKLMRGGEIFVPKIPSFRTIELIKAIYNKKPKIIGVRPGEKIHEDMISSSDALNTLEYKDYFCIYNKLSSFKSKNIKNFPRRCAADFTYTSANNKYFLNEKDLKKLFKNYSKNN